MGGPRQQLARLPAEFLALKHESRIIGHSSCLACGFSMMEQVRLCAVWPTENWLGSSLNQIQSSLLIWSTDIRSTRLYGQFWAGPNHIAQFVTRI